MRIRYPRAGRGALAALVAALTAMAMLAGGAAQAAAKKAPHYNHVFVVVLENENASTTFGPDTEAPYLAHRLKRKGAFVPNFYAIAHFSLTNYIAMVSGQSPNIQTQVDCPIFSDIVPGTPAGSGQVLGTGCVYPTGVETIGNQLGHAGFQWKGYVEDMNANAPKGRESPCRHPAVGERDPWQDATPTDQYATRHNPFVYFHSIIDFKHVCRSHDVDYSHLHRDLKHRRTTPSYSLMFPTCATTATIRRVRTGRRAGSSRPIAGYAGRCRKSSAPRPSSIGVS